MKLTFEQKPVDLYVLSLYVGWDSPERRQFRRVSYTLPILVLIGMSAWMLGNEITDPLIIGVLVLLAGASVYLLPRLVRWLQIKRIDGMIKRHPHPDLLIGPREIELTDTGITVRVKEQVSQYEWATMQKWVELKDHYLVFVKENVALVIPKGAFEYGSEEQDFVEKVNQHLGAALRHAQEKKAV